MNQDNKRLLRSNIINKIISGSELIKQALKGDNDILYSEELPTGKYELKDKSYIRINKEDIENNTYKDKLNLLLGLSGSTILDEDTDIESLYIQAKHIAIKDGLVFEEFDQDTLYELFSSMFKESKDKEKEIEDEISNMDNCEVMSDSVSSLTVDKDTENTRVEISKEPELNLGELDKSFKTSEFYNDKVYKKLDFKHLRSLKDKLLKSFKGYNGKISSYTPSKRFNLKKDIIDKDNIYFKNKSFDNNKIKINFIVDFSGSMRGSPVINAVSIIWLFNELAKEGYVEGNVIYTLANSKKGKLHKTFPMAEEEALTIAGARGEVEGIKTTAEQYAHILRNTHTICITDGNITDIPIKKSLWDSLRVYTTGVYVNEDVKDISKLNSYKENLLEYFHNGVVRENLDELINWFLKFKIKG